jgi:hypothetical protein
VKTLVGQLVMALLLFTVGTVLWLAAGLNGRIADAHQKLATLGSSAAADYGDIEASAAFATWDPWIGRPALTDARQHRALAEYWSGKYESIAKAETDLAPTDDDPELMFLSANAAYRASQQRQNSDRPAAQRALETAIKTYALILKKNPGDTDAAYNYEFAVRTLGAAANGRGPGAAIPRRGQVAGAPLPGTHMEEFHIVVPMRPEERDDFTEAGHGPPKVRKG